MLHTMEEWHQILQIHIKNKTSPSIAEIMNLLCDRQEELNTILRGEITK